MMKLTNLSTNMKDAVKKFASAPPSGRPECRSHFPETSVAWGISEMRDLISDVQFNDGTPADGNGKPNEVSLKNPVTNDFDTKLAIHHSVQSGKARTEVSKSEVISQPPNLDGQSGDTFLMQEYHLLDSDSHTKILLMEKRGVSDSSSSYIQYDFHDRKQPGKSETVFYTLEDLKS